MIYKYIENIISCWTFTTWAKWPSQVPKVGHHIEVSYNNSQIQPVQFSWLPSRLYSLPAGCSCYAAPAADKTNFRPLSGEFGIKKVLEMDLKIDQEPHFGATSYNMQGYCQVFTFLLVKTSYPCISLGTSVSCVTADCHQKINTVTTGGTTQI